MSFMKAYKHLDNLCRDMNGQGITGYLEDMEREQGGSCCVANWEADYKRLKHYRWVRNRIVHDDDAEEENMCQAEDAEWLDDFYNRILNQTDPLARYQKINASAFSNSATRERNASSRTSMPHSYMPYQSPSGNPGYTDYWNVPSTHNMKKRSVRMKKWIAGVMLLGAVGFMFYASRHPEFRWPWDSRTSYVICGSYIAVMLILFAMPNRK